MNGFTLWSTLGAVGAALTLGAAGQATRPQQPARLDVLKIVAQLELSGETRTAVRVVVVSLHGEILRAGGRGPVALSRRSSGRIGSAASAGATFPSEGR